jgi:hypothetical protein
MCYKIDCPFVWKDGLFIGITKKITIFEKILQKVVTILYFIKSYY